MLTANMYQAKAELSHLVEQACQGKEVVIARYGKPLVKLVPYRQQHQRKPGQLKGEIHIAEDFDTLPDEFIQFFQEST